MAGKNYQLDEGYAARVNAELVSAAEDFLAGNVGVIATARKMRLHLHTLSSHRTDLAEATLHVGGIASETDALPIGKLREIWHPSTGPIEDAKVKRAEDFYRLYMFNACRQIIGALIYTKTH